LINIDIYIKTGRVLILISIQPAFLCQSAHKEQIQYLPKFLQPRTKEPAYFTAELSAFPIFAVRIFTLPHCFLS